jgi:hypothetical protein
MTPRSALVSSGRSSIVASMRQIYFTPAIENLVAIGFQLNPLALFRCRCRCVGALGPEHQHVTGVVHLH